MWWQQQRLTERRRQLIGYSQQVSNQRRVIKAPQRRKHVASVCANNKKDHRESSTPDPTGPGLERFKCQRHIGDIGQHVIFLSADRKSGSSLWFPYIHCDLGEQIQLLHLHHSVGQRVDPIFVHRLSGVSNPVKPASKQTTLSVVCVWGQHWQLI